MFKGRSFLVKMVKDDDAGHQEEVDLGNEVKSHFEKYKAAYITGAVGVAFASFTRLYMKGSYPDVLRASESSIPRVLDGPAKVKITPLSLFSNRMTSNIVTVIKREGRGHPGYPVMDLDTGDFWWTQGESARALNAWPSVVSGHLNGKLPDVNGHHLARVGV